MNRRQFFGMTAAAVAAAGLPALVLPERTIFLPPRFGWKPAQLGQGYMREVEQYVINSDEMWYRYDAIGRDLWGKEHHFRVDASGPSPQVAARVIGDRFQRDGLIAIAPGESRQFKLALPNLCDGRRARYV